MLRLKWDDVDFGRGVLHVSRTLSETRTGHKFEKPKNGKGRAVELSRGALQALKNHRARQNEERHEAGFAWQDNGLVFPTTIGTTMRGTNLMNRHFLPPLERAGPPRVRLHDLRHDTTSYGTASQIRPRASRPRQHLHHARRVQPRPAGDGRRSRRRDGQRAGGLMARCRPPAPPRVTGLTKTASIRGA